LISMPCLSARKVVFVVRRYRPSCRRHNS
jgi:hypothetical protein